MTATNIKNINVYPIVGVKQHWQIYKHYFSLANTRIKKTIEEMVATEKFKGNIAYVDFLSASKDPDYMASLALDRFVAFDNDIDAMIFKMKME